MIRALYISKTGLDAQQTNLLLTPLKDADGQIYAMAQGNVMIAGAAHAKFTESMERSLANIDRALDRVLTVRTSMGASLRELDSLGNAVQDNTLHYDEQFSELLDLDYAAALTQFAREQTAQETAQLSYQRMSTLSLFNYL